MTNVYLVSSGESNYDYQLVAVCSTLEIAEDLIAKRKTIGKYDHDDIEAVELDVIYLDSGLSVKVQESEVSDCHSCFLRLDGQVRYDPPPAFIKTLFPPNTRSRVLAHTVPRDGGSKINGFYAESIESRDHAQQVATEAWQTYVRRKESGMRDEDIAKVINQRGDAQCQKTT